MKKILTILLTLVMAVCLINLNNSHTKAEGNDTYTVTFDMQGHGTQVDPQTVASGGKVTKPINPTAAGYAFDGWYKEDACTNKWDFDTDTVNADTTLYAKWDKPFTITATEDGTTTVTLTKEGGYTPPALNFSTNNGVNWNAYTYNNGIQITKDQSVMFKSTEDKSLSQDYNNYIKITADNKITASGNTMSLVSTNYSNETTASSYCFAFLFQNCTNLTSIDNLLLPAKTVGEGSYRNMFAGCTGLTSVPVDLLPATTLGVNCYFFMFGDCSNLTNIPNLPATTLADICYECMFIRCSKIKISATKTDNYVIPLKITDSGSASNPTQSMFSATGGTFTGDPVIGTTYYIATKGSEKSQDCTNKSGQATVCNVEATKGTENIVVHIKDEVGEQNPLTPSVVEKVSINDGKGGTATTLTKGIDYDLYTGSLTLILNKSLLDKLTPGGYNLTIKRNDGQADYNVTVVIKDNSPSPSKKDESCEKVIGPTWHWNNAKGICEDTGVVKTYTR